MVEEKELRRIISENIQHYMNQNNLTNVELSKILGVSESTVGKWLLKKSMPRMGVIERLSTLFGVPKSKLLEEHKPKPKSSLTRQEKILVIKYRALDEYGIQAVNDLLETEYKRVQDRKLLYDDDGNRITNFTDYINYKYKQDTSLYIDKVSAGLGYYPYEQDYQSIGSPVSGADYAFQVDGNSMFPSYHNGDMVYIRKQTTLENGEIGIVSYNNKGYLKQYYQNINTITLVSVNEDYENITIMLEDDTNFHIIGKVVGKVAVSEFLR